MSTRPEGIWHLPQSLHIHFLLVLKVQILKVWIGKKPFHKGMWERKATDRLSLRDFLSDHKESLHEQQEENL